jgi:3-hydroxyisobutyrate dehydrogenase-like beta-hydroxyacid dehydrogenase
MVAGKFDFGFAVEWMRKDLRICLEEARANGAELPLATLVDQFYADVVSMGGKRWDTSSLIARLNRSDKGPAPRPAAKRGAGGA